MLVKSKVSFGKGGICFPERDAYEHIHTIQNAFIPPSAIVPLNECPEAEVRCLVYQGQRVEECQIIGRSDNAKGANVHSPIPGEVREIRKIILPGGLESEAVVIDLSGSFSRLGRKQELYPWKSLSAGELDHVLSEKGVIGLERKPIALHPVFASARKSAAQAIIINAVDVEPFDRTELAVICLRPEQICSGIEIALKTTGAQRAIFIYSSIHAQSLSGFFKVVEEAKLKISFIATEPIYPQGFSSQLRTAAMSIPAKICPAAEIRKAPIFNISTLYAMYEAIALNKPFMERTVHVGGDAVKHPSTLKVRVGMRIGDLIEECGGFKGLPARIVINGPLTGHAVEDLDIPVMKGMRSILALTEAEIRASRGSSCIRCARCVETCPEGLNPELVFRLLRAERLEEAEAAGIARCSLCGACGYICPSRVSLVDTFSKFLAKARKDGESL